MTEKSPSGRQTWRMYTARDGKKIERFTNRGLAPPCPCCGGALETEADALLTPLVILDATACDLVCRTCKRFWCLVRHTPRSMQLMRMRRLAAAVRAVGPVELSAVASTLPATVQ